ncbi:HAMP domain-containing sensor histidine kinase [Collinsella sp. An2]|uniref:sensor histidine kinase n=1 Tax=Collinsella sp. An2 TaxID=1965585 RepID=UPI001EF66AEA|nr:HAMP domain-containing sensor histidine kinase [Collinsella sp. An2]
MKFSNGSTGQGKQAHAPVNPVTGRPNVAGAGQPTAPAGRNDASVSSKQERVAATPGAAEASGTTTAGSAPSTAPSSQTGHAASDASAVSGGDASSVIAAAEADVDDVDSRMSADAQQLQDLVQTAPDAAESNAELLERVRRIVDNRIVSIVMLFVLLVAVVGAENLLMFLILMLVGYILIDRFVNVRRCIVMGGLAWLLVIFVGRMIADSAQGPIVFGIDYLFMFCGFLLALAVCAAFFAGRYMYYRGFDSGQAQADHDIAQHMVDRLIERPDDWSGLDGDYLEVESALNRVRERERMAQQALRDEARRKDDLVTYLAHDLKTPLASVVGYLSLLEEAPDLPVEQRAHFTGIALEKAHRLDTLIEEFFDITRFDFHDIVLTRGYVDLNLLLSQVAEEFYPTLAEQHKEALIDVPVGLTVLVDGDKMARVFNNVMKNAIAYSYEGSTIRVSARRNDNTVCIKFENQGDPIPAPKLKVIFEKFYRLDAARATNRGGAGLGLAIAKEIVTAHNGTIECSSTPEATVFTITLPV